MHELINYGWLKREASDIKYKNKFQRISILMAAYKSLEIENFQYVLIEQYFISDNNLYFIGNDEIYSIDLNDDFNLDFYKDSKGDYDKIKFICKYSKENIIKFELLSNEFKREKRLKELGI